MTTANQPDKCLRCSRTTDGPGHTCPGGQTRRFPMLRTEYPRETPLYPALLVQWSEGEMPIRCCGDSWCLGQCGMPALVIPAIAACSELKAYSAMVACGSVMQAWRVEWKRMWL